METFITCIIVLPVCLHSSFSLNAIILIANGSLLRFPSTNRWWCSSCARSKVVWSRVPLGTLMQAQRQTKH